jgi:hypothetical protein
MYTLQKIGVGIGGSQYQYSVYHILSFLTLVQMKYDKIIIQLQDEFIIADITKQIVV